MLKIILCSVLLWSSLSIAEEVPRFISPECDHLGINTFMGMGLEPQFVNNEECPSSWKWPEEKSEKCNFMGKYYNHDEDFIKKDGYTETSCKCNIKKGNQRIFCEPANYTAMTWESSDLSYTCEPGKHYGNEEFWPENACLQCKCKPGFKGDYVPPFCKRIANDLSSNYQKEIDHKCTPHFNIYSNYEKPALCNAYGFICNEDLYEISPINVVKDSMDSSSMCTIDNELYPRGTVLNVTYINYNTLNSVNCTCLTPPFFTCVNIHPKRPMIIRCGTDGIMTMPIN